MDLPYRTRSHVQYLTAAYSGKSLEIHIYVYTIYVYLERVNHFAVRLKPTQHVNQQHFNLKIKRNCSASAGPRRAGERVAGASARECRPVTKGAPSQAREVQAGRLPQAQARARRITPFLPISKSRHFFIPFAFIPTRVCVHTRSVLSESLRPHGL